MVGVKGGKQNIIHIYIVLIFQKLNKLKILHNKNVSYSAIKTLEKNGQKLLFIVEKMTTKHVKRCSTLLVEKKV